MSKSGVSITAILPLAWELESGTSAATSELRNQGNIALMQALAAIESAHDQERDMPEAMRKGLERVESKLDIILLLIARLAGEALSMPPERPFSLFHDHVVWDETTDNLPEPGKAILLHIYLSPRVPQPLVLPAVVGESMPLPNGARITASFGDVGEETTEWITRTIFRHHRRAIHAIRQP